MEVADQAHNLYRSKATIAMNSVNKTMRFLVAFLLIIFQVHLNYGQTSLAKIDLEKGPYSVGFLHYTSADSSRTYSRIYDYSNEKIARPIPISIWYPSTQNVDSITSLRVLDYLQILKEEEEWENLPNEQILNWFYYANSPANQAHLKEKTNAYTDLEKAEGKYPLVVYAPSFQASSIENFALCEYLASEGFIVIASPSRGTETRWFGNKPEKEIETQARDVEFLIKKAMQLPNADPNKIAVMGFSFGGLSNVTAQMRNENIKAMVSLDGTERYQYALLKKSPFFDLNKLDVPYLHMAQKDIPEMVLKEDKIDSTLNTRFDLYDSLSLNRTYRLKFLDLTHAYFSTLGVLFEVRDTRQDKSDLEIMNAYKWVSILSLSFLKAYLLDDNMAKTTFKGQLEQISTNNKIISYQKKGQKGTAFTFNDFNDLAASKDYNGLWELYEQSKIKHPNLNLPEGSLNTLGLQLIFNSKTSNQGVNVFNLAIRLYPKSANLYDSLAEGFLYLGNHKKAIVNFKKSLDLNPHNQNAIDRLKSLTATP
ncbi:alpha/beta hydrolase [Cyclobacterium amurskyense]|uniref:Tetratricopeptide TPR_2 repeat-containing protein n=1 Tax=Cyclobacterium amurskyense TaxID=320787 RepID=A0A0H4PFQ9_9BACT|nr:dienelactone hydrolase family protein [Cyclobacterium amurskyense]AKP53321.1 Tetratricopeptide TPR_2 repeat-containing protein [Cyclobacterium amurskyense]